MPIVQLLVPSAECERAWKAPRPLGPRLALIADMCRLNTLTAVKRAGSGHLGSSFSAMDIVTWLYYARMNTIAAGLGSPDRDVYFSSKGHDVPGLYAVLYARGVLSREKFLLLRRLGGLDGHPDVGVPGIEANSGSLGMGISKAKGIAWAKRRRGHGGHVFVMTGDGELQEGQNYEALQTAVSQRLGGLTVIVDHNKVQSDKCVREIVDLGDLEGKLGAFGWHVRRGNGHDPAEVARLLAELAQDADRPGVLIADTIKGRGVSFMEHPAALEAGGGSYPWHAGAPADEAFDRASRELVERLQRAADDLGLGRITIEEIAPEATSGAVVALDGEPVSPAAQARLAAGVSDEYLVKVYGEAIVDIGRARADVVVLDADLAADCRVRDFEIALPAQFIENGIAEQDMVSMAGGLARHGFLPVVNSFASFLASRANEQIYNNAGERTHIVYVCHYGGLLPAGPGKSHQSLRDVSLFAAIPDSTIVQPANAFETRWLLDYLLNTASGVCVLRLPIGPSPRRIPVPAGYVPRPGQGVTIADGRDALMFAYGPVMLHEALSASELLAERGFGLSVINMPWLNRIDGAWLSAVVAPFDEVYVLEDHAPVGALGDRLARLIADDRTLQGRRLTVLGVDGHPACGTPAQALGFHGLDGRSLAERLLTRAKPAAARAHA